MEKTLKLLLVLRRRKSSNPCFPRGLLRFIVGLVSLFSLNTSHPSLTAESDWHFYSLEKSTPSTGALDLSADEGSDAMEHEEGGSDINPDDRQSGAQILEEIAASLLPVTDGGSPKNVSTQLATPEEVETASDSPLLDLPDDTLPTFPDEASTPAAGITDHEAPDLLDHSVTLGTLVSAGGSQWMKSKKTLVYFHGAHKMGKLSDVILHWYKLEEALGFQESVSCVATQTEALY